MMKQTLHHPTVEQVRNPRTVETLITGQATSEVRASS